MANRGKKAKDQDHDDEGAKLEREVDQALGKKNIVRILTEDGHFKHLNHGTEGNPAAPVRRLDLKFEAVVDGELLKQLCGAEELPPLWNADRSVRYLGLSGFESRAILKDAKFEFGDLEFHRITIEGVTVNQFKFTPVQGRAINLNFRVQVKPTDEQMIALSHAVLKKAQLVITCDMGVVMDQAKDDKQGTLPMGDDNHEDPDAQNDARH